MADRISALEAEKAAVEARTPSRATQKQAPGEKESSDDPGVAQLRVDLAEALRSKGVTETRLRTAEEELEKLRSKTKDDFRTLRTLDVERMNLTTRLKDREYELREKRKLLEVFNPRLAVALCDADDATRRMYRMR